MCAVRNQRDAEGITRSLPSGYSSVYVPGLDGEVEGAALSSAASFTDVYYVLDRSRCQVTHVVEFELVAGGGAVDPRGAVNNCVVCSFGQGVVECVDCGGPLCMLCNRNVHMNLAAAKHSRVAIRTARAEDMCPVHPSHALDRFCTARGVPVCVQCKLDDAQLKSTPGRGAAEPEDEARPTSYVTLDVMYEELAGGLDGLGEARKALVRLRDQANAHAESLAEQTSRKAAAFNSELARYLQGHLHALEQADERRFVITRALTDIDRCEEFLRFQQQTTTHVGFLNVWNFYRALRDSINARLSQVSRTPADLTEVGLDDKDKEILALRRIIQDKDDTIDRLRDVIRGLHNAPPKKKGAALQQQKSALI